MVKKISPPELVLVVGLPQPGRRGSGPATPRVPRPPQDPRPPTVAASRASRRETTAPPQLAMLRDQRGLHQPANSRELPDLNLFDYPHGSWQETPYRDHVRLFATLGYTPESLAELERTFTPSLLLELVTNGVSHEEIAAPLLVRSYPDDDDRRAACNRIHEGARALMDRGFRADFAYDLAARKVDVATAEACVAAGYRDAFSIAALCDAGVSPALHKGVSSALGTTDVHKVVAFVRLLQPLQPHMATADIVALAERPLAAKIADYASNHGLATAIRLVRSDLSAETIEKARKAALPIAFVLDCHDQGARNFDDIKTAFDDSVGGLWPALREKGFSAGTAQEIHGHMVRLGLSENDKETIASNLDWEMWALRNWMDVENIFHLVRDGLSSTQSVEIIMALPDDPRSRIDPNNLARYRHGAK